MASEVKDSGSQSKGVGRRFGLWFRLALLIAIYLLSPGPVFYVRHLSRLAEIPIGPASADAELDTTEVVSDEKDQLIRTIYAPVFVLREHIPAVDGFYDWYLHLFVPRSPRETKVGAI
ncbi:MAG: hypothetical protein AB7O26_10030 [Planctomycetaceae bacterium]